MDRRPVYCSSWLQRVRLLNSWAGGQKEEEICIISGPKSLQINDNSHRYQTAKQPLNSSSCIGFFPSHNGRALRKRPYLGDAGKENHNSKPCTKVNGNFSESAIIHCLSSECGGWWRISCWTLFPASHIQRQTAKYVLLGSFALWNLSSGHQSRHWPRAQCSLGVCLQPSGVLLCSNCPKSWDSHMPTETNALCLHRQRRELRYVLTLPHPIYRFRTVEHHEVWRESCGGQEDVSFQRIVC